MDTQTNYQDILKAIFDWLVDCQNDHDLIGGITVDEITNLIDRFYQIERLERQRLEKLKVK